MTINVYSQSTISLIDKASGGPIVGAKVVLANENKSFFLLSNLDGFVDIKKLKPSSYKYEVSATGLEKINGEYKFSGGDDTLVFQLQTNRLFETVIVTAQYEPTITSDAIQKSTVISNEQIVQSGAVNLADILTYQTGIRLSQDNVLGSSMSLGGLSGQNVKILIDGVPVIGRQDGNIDLSQINLSNIERIEVVEGPLSVNFGTNALAGTINLITKKTQKKSFSFSVNPYYESIGNFNLSGRLGLKVKKHAISIAGGRNFFDGWSANDAFFEFPKSKLADTSRFKTWKPKEQFFFDIGYSTHVKSWNIAPFVRYFDEIILNRGLPLAPYNQVGLDDYYHTIRKDCGFNLSKEFKRASFKTIVAYNQFERKKNTYIKDLTTLSQSLSEAIGAQDTALFTLLNIRPTYIHKFGSKLSLEAGIDINQESAYGKRIAGLEKQQGDYAAYITTEWEPIKNIKLKPGLRYAYNTNYQAPVTPSINIFYKLNNFRFRGSAARGFRAPTLKELYFDFVDINHNIQGNVDLKSEFSYNYSLGISWLKKVKNSYLFQADYTAFYNDIENLITLGAIADGSFSYINVGVFKSLGNQIKLTLKSKRLTSTLATTYIGRYNQLNGESTEVDRFSFSPEASLNVSVDLIKDKLKFNTFYKYNGALKTYSLIGEEIRENKQSAYSILDVSMSVYLLKKRLHITSGVKNVLNVQQVSVVGTTGGAHSGGGNLNAARGASVFVSCKYQINYDFKKK